MIADCGVLTSAYAPTDTIADALALAGDRHGVAWIASEDASEGEVERVGRAIGLDDEALAHVVERRSTSRVPRARATRLAKGAHLVLLGWEQEPSGGARLRGQLELLVWSGSFAVIASGCPEAIRPLALREAVVKSADRVPVTRAPDVLGIVLSRVLDLYEDVLDALEDEVVAVSDALFVERSGEQLRRIYELSRPLHAATVSTRPLAHGFDRLTDGDAPRLETAVGARLRSEIVYVAGRLTRIDALLNAAMQTYFNLAQDEANRLASVQSDITRRMSAWALLIAIPTIIFSLYGTNFERVPLLDERWGYGVMLAFTAVLCLYAWRRLRAAEWL